MARPRTNHESKKQELIKISFDLFMKQGYEDTSIQDIMKAAQISKGAMYHYFASKEEILDAVLNHIIDMEAKLFEPVLQDDSLSCLEKLTAMTSFKPSQGTEEARLANEYISKRAASIFEYRARDLSKTRSLETLIHIVQQGVSAGEFHTEYPEEMAEFIYASGQVLGEFTLSQPEQQVLIRKISAFIQLLVKCLGLEKKDEEYLIRYFASGFDIPASQLYNC